MPRLPRRLRDLARPVVPPDRGGVGGAALVKPPARAYRGFPFVIGLTTEGLDASTQVAVQVKRKGRWSTVAKAGGDRAHGRRRGQPPPPLQGGALPAAGERGRRERDADQRREALPRAQGEGLVDVGQDGRRVERQGQGAARLLPGLGNGRTIKAGRFQLTLLCPTPGMVNPFTIQIADAPLPRAQIAPDGSFVFAGVVQGAASFVRGRIRGRTASGVADMTLGTCTGGAAFTAAK